MEFKQYKVKIADGSYAYGGLSIKEILNMGYNNFHIYLTKYQKRKLSPEQTKIKYRNYVRLS